MLKQQRHSRIIEILSHKQAVTSMELCRLFSVSHETIRKDLDALAALGLLERTFGGAIHAQLTKELVVDRSVEERSVEHIAEKKAIGEYAAGLVAPHDTIVLDSSTTTLYLARKIPENQGIIVITNALFILQELAAKPGITLISVGGNYRDISRSFLGPVALESLLRYNVVKAFMSGNAFSLERGLMDPNDLEPEFKRKMIEVAQETILLMDHTKFSRVAPFTVCPASAFSTVISDAGLAQDYVDALEQHGRQVIRCTSG